jgi:5-oxoprolinase (ATP-hydrolysing)
MAGGGPGARGRAVLARTDGSVWELGGRFDVEVARGDVLRLETPGGGGWGPAGEAEPRQHRDG